MADALLAVGVEIVVLLSPLAIGGAYWYYSGKRLKFNESQRESQRIKDRMLRIFREEIVSSYRHSNDEPAGKIRLLEFCSKAEVSAETGKLFLQNQVADFAGVIDVDEFGDITYYFGDAKAKFIKGN